MVTALYFTGIVCFTPRAGLGTAVTEVLYLDTPLEAEPHPRTAHLPLKHTVPAEIRDWLFQTFYRSHFALPNPPHMHFSLPVTHKQRTG